MGLSTRPSPASPATTCPTAARGSTPRPSARSTRSTPAPASSCSSPTSTRCPSCSPRSSPRGPRCSRTTSRPCRASSSRSARASATTARCRCSPRAREAGLVTKSNLILGMGETIEEVVEALQDLHDAGCDLITITQYLRPSVRHHPVDRWVRPEEFVELSDEAERIGLPRRHVRPARALVVPCRSAVGPGDATPRPADPGGARAPRRADDGPPGGVEPARPLTHGAPGDARGRPQAGRRLDFRPMARERRLPTHAAQGEEDPLVPPGLAGVPDDPQGRPGGHVVAARRRSSASSRSALVIGLAGRHVVYLLLAEPAVRRCSPRCSSSPGAPRRPPTARSRASPAPRCAALRTIRRGWTFPEEPVAVDPRTQDLVFRGVGRAGVVLVGEGPRTAVGKLLEAERKRTARVLPGVPITADPGRATSEGQVPLRKLARTVQRLKPTLTKQEIAEIAKRLRRPRRRAAAGAQGHRPDARPPRPQGHARPLSRARRRPTRAVSAGRSTVPGGAGRAGRGRRRPTRPRGRPGTAGPCARAPRTRPGAAGPVGASPRSSRDGGATQPDARAGRAAGARGCRPSEADEQHVRRRAKIAERSPSGRPVSRTRGSPAGTRPRSQASVQSIAERDDAAPERRERAGPVAGSPSRAARAARAAGGRALEPGTDVLARRHWPSLTGAPSAHAVTRRVGRRVTRRKHVSVTRSGNTADTRVGKRHRA